MRFWTLDSTTSWLNPTTQSIAPSTNTILMVEYSSFKSQPCSLSSPTRLFPLGYSSLECMISPGLFHVPSFTLRLYSSPPPSELSLDVPRLAINYWAPTLTTPSLHVYFNQVFHNLMHIPDTQIILTKTLCPNIKPMVESDHLRHPCTNKGGLVINFEC